MFRYRSFRWQGVVWLFALGAANLIFPQPASAQEKIRISKGEETIEIPGRTPKDDVFSRPFDDFRSKTDGAGSLEPVLPSIPVNPRTAVSKEKTDEKNWIFPKEFDQDAMLKEIFKIRDYGLDGLEKKPKTGFERILGINKEGTDGSSVLSLTPSSPSSMEDKLDPKNLGPLTPEMLSRYRHSPRYQEDDRPATDVVLELSFENLLRATRPFDTLNQPSSDVTGMALLQKSFNQTFNRLMPVRFPRTREQEQRSKDFQKLLPSNRQFLTPRLNDPLASQSDETRQEVNPVTGKRIEESSLTSSLGTRQTPMPDPAAGLSGVSRGSSISSVLDSMNPKGAGRPITTPSTFSPSAAPVMQPGPPVLEIPRRKF